jgi:hypothetical protein
LYFFGASGDDDHDASGYDSYDAATCDDDHDNGRTGDHVNDDNDASAHG